MTEKITQTPAQKFLHNFENSLSLDYENRVVSFTDNLNWQKINNRDTDTRIEIGFYAFELIIEKYYSKYEALPLRKKIFKREFISRLSILPKEKIELVFERLLQVSSLYNLPYNDLLLVFKNYYERFGITESYATCRDFFENKRKRISWSDVKLTKFADGLQAIEAVPTPEEFCFDKNDILGKKIASELANYPREMIEIIQLCWGETAKSQPTKGWQKKSVALIESTTSKDEIIQIISSWLSLLVESGKSITRQLNTTPENSENINECKFWNLLKDFNKNREKYYLLEKNEVGICYLIWFCINLNDSEINKLIGDLAVSSFTKVKWNGNLSDKNGNACLYAISQLPNEFGIIQFYRIKKKSSNKNVLNLINRYLKKKCEEARITEDALLELVTPDFGIKNDQIIQRFGNFEGIISTQNPEKPVLTWIDTQNNKVVKTLPKELVEFHEKELKEFKSLLKEIPMTFQVHKSRIENTYLNNIEWSTTNWDKLYHHHPILSKFSSVLIWWFDEKVTAILHDKFWIDENGREVNFEDFSSVKLWHPIFSSAKVVEKWRNFIFTKELKQPFKQAYRECYRVTDAEIQTDYYSNRFAAHILNQSQLLSLCKHRVWDFSVIGLWDSDNYPSKKVPAFNLEAIYVVAYVEDSVNPNIVYKHVQSDQVRFKKNQEILPIQSVPSIVFTEVMRDIDLFVGVSSVGNNPNWQDTGVNGHYWSAYVFSELSENAKTRKAVLEKIIPRLKIASKCSFTDRYLVVKGDIRTYKIHLGSGNILMSPNDQYLCIVPNNRLPISKIFLPFEDDTMLSIILSKAFLLAEDHKIDDLSIINQIKSPL